MQWKMAAKSRFVERFHEWAMRRGFPLMAWFTPRVPRRWLLVAAQPVMAMALLFYQRPQRAIERNLARILGDSPRSRRVRRLRRRVIANLAIYWADLFRFAQLPYAEARRLLARVEGAEHLDRAVAAGRGVVLLTAHLGNWELGAVFMREVETPVSVVYVPDRSPTAEAFRAFLRGKIEVDEIAIDPRAELSSLPILRALKEGRVVAVQGDRDFNDRGVPVEFFGAPAPFPLGPMLLARLTGAMLVPIFIVYDERHRVELEIGEPIEVATDGDRETATRRALERWVAVLEEAVARRPEQWYSFYDFWGDPEEADPAAATPPAARREAV